MVSTKPIHCEVILLWSLKICLIFQDTKAGIRHCYKDPYKNCSNTMFISMHSLACIKSEVNFKKGEQNSQQEWTFTCLQHCSNKLKLTLQFCCAEACWGWWRSPRTPSCWCGSHYPDGCSTSQWWPWRPSWLSWSWRVPGEQRMRNKSHKTTSRRQPEGCKSVEKNYTRLTSRRSKWKYF